MRKLSGIYLLLLAFAVVLLGTELPKDASRNSYPLLIKDPNSSKWYYTCVAVAIENQAQHTTLLTAAHCIRPGREYAIALDDVEQPVAIDRISATGDFAVLKVEKLLEPISLGHDPVVGDIVSIFGWSQYGVRLQYIGKVTEILEDHLDVYLPGLELGVSGAALFCVDQAAMCGIVVGVHNDAPVFGAAEGISRFYNSTWLIHQGA